MVTGGTLNKGHHFNSPEKLSILQEFLCGEAHNQGWNLQAWAVFSNHYHFIAYSPKNDNNLKTLIRSLHSKTAIEVNRLDKKPGRRVWFQYWDTCLTYEKSYLARLNYVMHNPVHHGFVGTAEEYAFCSTPWFTKTADPGFCQKVSNFPFDKIVVKDDF
jgi:putative transposase